MRRDNMGRNRSGKVWAFLMVVGIAVVALAGCSSGGGTGQSVQCCALHRFCTTCTTCEPAEIATGTGTDEAACKSVNDYFQSVGKFCNMNNRAPTHSIGEFILQCGG